MTKSEFTEKYKNLITVYFNFDELENNPTIEVNDGTRMLSEFLDFYVPRYKKYGQWDGRHISQIIPDEESAIIKLKDVLYSPQEWDLLPFEDANTLSKKLWPIPVATDKNSGRTLILDSNHTVCTLLLAGFDMKVPYIELAGKDLSELVVDFKRMQS